MIQTLTLLATPLLFVSSLPQFFKLVRTKRSGDISVWTYALTWLAVGLLVLDSYQAGDTSLIVANGWSFFMLTINLTLILRYATPNS